MYRVGGQLDRILEGVRLLQRRKRRAGAAQAVVELQFIAMAATTNTSCRPCDRLSSGRAAESLKSVGLGDVNRDPARRQWLPAQPSLRRYYEEHNGQWGCIRSSESGPMCDQPWHRLVINWDGQAPCCYDQNGVCGGNAAEARCGTASVWAGVSTLRLSSPPAICRRCAAPLWGSSIN